jgi:hypothetical protein
VAGTNLDAGKELWRRFLGQVRRFLAVVQGTKGTSQNGPWRLLAIETAKPGLDVTEIKTDLSMHHDLVVQVFCVAPHESGHGQAWKKRKKKGKKDKIVSEIEIEREIEREKRLAVITFGCFLSTKDSSRKCEVSVTRYWANF